MIKISSIIILLAFFFSACNNNNEYVSHIQSKRVENDSILKLSENSPLPDSVRTHFAGLEYFPIDEDFKVTADFVRAYNQAEFGMKTTTDRLPVYRKFADAYFNLKGIKCKLTVYQNTELMDNPKFKDYLFVPFTDKTSGEESYAGGRYLDLRIPNDDKIVLDFNLAYNPYCNYNSRYSCPIPPSENDLKVEILAGEKDFHKSH